MPGRACGEGDREAPGELRPSGKKAAATLCLTIGGSHPLENGLHLVVREAFVVPDRGIENAHAPSARGVYSIRTDLT